MLGFYTRSSAAVTIPVGTAGTATATCDPGDLATGGGYTGSANGIFLTEVNAPLASDSWTVTARNFAATPLDLITHVMCADFA